MGSLIRSTGIVAISTLGSRILGFVREMLFASFFGATGSTDAFFLAFRIPNLLRRLVAEGALTISFIPVYSEYLIKRGEEESLLLAQKTLSILMLIIVFLIGVGIIFAPQIVGLFGLGFRDFNTIALAVELTKVMFPYLFFIGFVAFSMGILNSHGYFFAPAFSPVLLNVGIITGIVIFTSFFKVPLYGVAAGVIFGGILQLFLQIPYLIKTGFHLKISFDFKHEGIRKIFKLMGPALFGTAIYQINIVMGTILASMLNKGSISYLYYSDRLTEMVLGVFIVSIGSVILPEMSKMSASENFDKLKDLYSTALSSALFLAIPSAVALMIVGFPVISIVFLRGEFSLHDAQMTYRALFFASMGISSVAILRITTPTFYSLKDTKTPVYSAAIAFLLNISLGYLFMQTELKHAGLSLANSISVTVQVVILLFFFQRKFGKIRYRTIFNSLIKVVISSIIMGISVYYLAGLFNWNTSGIIIKIFGLILIVLTGGIVYLTMTYVLKTREIIIIKDKIFSKRR